ncbi:MULTISPECIES: DDE-type integrase/transposase/recombinase [unclassified Rhizobium]|uniref:DDE-type integrase/transposase/recombinase n=1 Tax=unclassified Rhizobium TaxID=2613769 RepID=UPI001782829E|nr:MULTISPECIES: DDE-type integrase/transposase/recombinase [unclassified Rhizobium]MBD8687192.1 transposase family protein [Rhizobium sp. CFBP 13644]MBD8691005.1 transposase family protein [Rhizobium sp. CFBP 13717]
MTAAPSTKQFSLFGIGPEDRIRFDNRYWCLKSRRKHEGGDLEAEVWEHGYIFVTCDDLDPPKTEVRTFEQIDEMHRWRHLEQEKGWFSTRNAIYRQKLAVRIFDLPSETIFRARMVAEFLELEIDRYESGAFVTRSDSGYEAFIKDFVKENEHLIPTKKGKREVIPGPRQFGRLVKRYEENNYDPQSLLPRHRGGVGRKTDFSPEELGFHVEFATAYQSRDRPTKIDCYAQMGEANQKRKAGGDSAMRVPSLRTFQRIIDGLGDYKNEVTRAGDPSRVTRKYSISRRGYQPQRPLEFVEMDEHKFDVIRMLVKTGMWEMLHPEVREKIENKMGSTNDGRVWLSVALDAYSRSVCGAKLLWGAPDGASAVATLAMVARSKQLETRLYGTMTQWPQGGTAEYIHVDAGSSYTSHEFQQAALSYTGHVSVPASKHPHLRGRVERFFRTLNQRYIHLLSGQTFSNVLLRDRYDAQKHRHMTDEQLAEFLVLLIVDCYHNTPHRALKGLTPLQMWYHGTQKGKGTVAGYPDPRTYAEAFSVIKTYKVGKDGISILGLPYSNEWLQSRRETRYDLELSVKINEIDISRILVKDPFSQEWFEVACAFDGLENFRALDWMEQLKYLKKRFGTSSTISVEVARSGLSRARDLAQSSKASAGIGAPTMTSATLEYWEKELVGSFKIAREASTDYGDSKVLENFHTLDRPDPFAPATSDTHDVRDIGGNPESEVLPPASAPSPRPSAKPVQKETPPTLTPDLHHPLPRRKSGIRIERTKKDEK